MNVGWLAKAAAASAAVRGADGPHSATFRFGEKALHVRTDGKAFLDRLREIYAECEQPADPAVPPALRCRISADGGEPLIAASLQDGVPLDQLAFNLSLFPDQRYRRLEAPGANVIARAASPDRPFAAFYGDEDVALDRDQPWEAFLGHYIVHRLLRLQTGLLFFHASAVVIDGAGVLFAGPEASGKTTLSLTLTSRGHEFFGDDLAAVRMHDWHLLPVRRSASIRRGPAAAGQAERLAAGGFRQEQYADGEWRTRAAVGQLYAPSRLESAPLAAVIFLRGFADGPRLEPAAAGPDLARWLTPLGSTLWGVPPGRRMLDFFRLLSGAQCYFLAHGRTPDDTAAAVERLLEDTWGSRSKKKPSMSAPSAPSAST